MKVLFKGTNEIKEVNDNYAVNFLLPKGLAVLATDKVINNLEKKAEARQSKKEIEAAKQEELAKKLDGKKITMVVKSNDKGELYGSIGKKEIKKQLKIKELFEINPNDPITQTGIYSLCLQFGKCNAQIQLEVKSS